MNLKRHCSRFYAKSTVSYKYFISKVGEMRFTFVSGVEMADAHVVALYVISHGGDFRWDAFDPKFLFNILAEEVNISIKL